MVADQFIQRLERRPVAESLVFFDPAGDKFVISVEAGWFILSQICGAGCKTLDPVAYGTLADTHFIRDLSVADA